MRLFPRRASKTGVLILSTVAAYPSVGLNIVLDYTHDTYIQTNPTALAALEAAADDLEAVITSVLPARTDSNSVTVGKATAEIDWNVQYSNPATGTLITIDPVDIPADEFRVFVGVRNITQPGSGSKTLGTGGPASSVGISSGWSIDPLFTSEIPQAIADMGTAVAQLEADANANAGRGGVGPNFGTFSNITFAGTIGSSSFSYSADVDYGLTAGNLWFDVDTDDDSNTDSNATLDAYWHWNHTTPTPTGKNDFYTVALHELLHTLGYGTSDSWDDLINPSDPDEWLGSELIALLGTGENAVDTQSGAHLRSGLLGNVLGTTTAQEAVMDPSITVGSRKLLTDLDAAVLDDIGFTIASVAVTITGDFDGSGAVGQGDLNAVLLNWGSASAPAGFEEAALSSGGPFDGNMSQNELNDVLLNWGNTAEIAGASVPEPAVLIVVGFGGMLLSGRRKH